LNTLLLRAAVAVAMTRAAAAVLAVLELHRDLQFLQALPLL
jgi:hypothetical protein